MEEAQAPNNPAPGIIDRWLFVPNPRPLTRAYELKRCRARAYLLESLHRCVTKHDLHEAFELIRVLPKETFLDPYALLRFILILVESSPSQRINKNVIIYLEALMSKLDISKPDAFVEFLAYFIRNNRISDAKELFDERHRYMLSKIHRPLPYVDTNVRCYEFYLHYLSWVERITTKDVKPNFDVSTQGWLVNAIDCFKTATSNHEYFVICLLRVLLYYGYLRKAYLFMSEFQRNNPNNLGAQLIHFKLLKQLDAMSVTGKAEHMLEHRGAGDEDVPMLPEELTWEQRLEKRSADLQAINNFSSSDTEEGFESNIYPLDEDRRRILKNLRTLDPAGRELMELSAGQENPIAILRDLLDGLETIREISNITRWQAIRKLIDSLTDRATCQEARDLWSARYRQYWLAIDMVSLVSDEIAHGDRKFIEETHNLLISFLEHQQQNEE